MILAIPLVCAKLFVILDCSLIFSSDWVYFTVGRPLISYPIGGFLSTSSAEPLLNSRDYRGVFVDTKKATLKSIACCDCMDGGIRLSAIGGNKSM